jgi:outer membrane protein OmpA-like peptidoglycan-associated protein
MNLNLANSKTDGTIVPAFGLGDILGVVGFAFNSYEISPDGKKSLAGPKLWNALKKAVKTIEIVGNTDSVGSLEYNQKLSEQRAESVSNLLQSMKQFRTLKKGVSVTTRGAGKTNLIKNDKKGKDGRASALNRRVEFIIDGKPIFDYSKLK